MIIHLDRVERRGSRFNSDKKGRKVVRKVVGNTDSKYFRNNYKIREPFQ